VRSSKQLHITPGQQTRPARRLLIKPAGVRYSDGLCRSTRSSEELPAILFPLNGGEPCRRPDCLSSEIISLVSGSVLLNSELEGKLATDARAQKISRPASSWSFGMAISSGRSPMRCCCAALDDLAGYHGFIDEIVSRRKCPQRPRLTDLLQQGMVTGASPPDLITVGKAGSCLVDRAPPVDA
jgi:hypothetical protein